MWMECGIDVSWHDIGRNAYFPHFSNHKSPVNELTYMEDFESDNGGVQR